MLKFTEIDAKNTILAKCKEISGQLARLGYKVSATNHLAQRMLERRIPAAILSEALDRVCKLKLCEFLFLAASNKDFCIRYQQHKDYYMFLTSHNNSIHIRTTVKHDKGSYHHGMPILDI